MDHIQTLERRLLFAVFYHVQLLGRGTPAEINDAGQVVGNGVLNMDDGDLRSIGFRTTPTGTINEESDLGGLGLIRPRVFVFGINSSGVVAGSSLENFGGAPKSFRIAPGDKVDTTSEDIGALEGGGTYAYDINDSGQLVGITGDVRGRPDSGPQYAYRTTATGNITSESKLGTFGGYSFPWAINNAGQVVGYSENEDGFNRAFRTTATGKITANSDLGTFGGDTAIAYDINASGQVVGGAGLADGTSHAFLTTSNGKITQQSDLGTLGGTTSTAFGVNDAGAVVGTSRIENDAASHAFIYANGTMIDLNDVARSLDGWVLTSARSINKSGQISVEGRLNGAGATHAFRLTPISDIQVTSLSWNAKKGGVSFRYSIENGPLDEDAAIELYWASGTSSSSRIGDAVHVANVSDGRGAIHVDGEKLRGAPKGATHLVVVADLGNDIEESDEDNNAKSLADVTISFSKRANDDVLSKKTLRLTRELLRMSGQESAVVTTTFQKPADFARELFNDCVSDGVDALYDVHKRSVDKVINVFETETDGLSAKEIQDNKAEIRKKMAAKIRAVGSSKVSAHLGNFDELQAFDLLPATISAKATSLLAAAAIDLGFTRVRKPNDNAEGPEFHLEIEQ